MIQVIGGGYGSRHVPASRIIRTSGNADYLIVITRSNASFTVNGETYLTTPNTLILFDKYTPYNYGSINEEYINDWLHFDFLDEKPLFEELMLPLNIPITLPEVSIFSTLITLLINELYLKGPYLLENLDSYTRILLHKLSEHIRILPNSVQSHPYYPAMNQLRASIHNAPYDKWTVSRMADELHMSPSYFQHLYKDLFGISCINDVIGIRIAYARYHLKNTDLSIQEVAELCGYENDVHFIRQFKKLVGMTPGEYRRNVPVNTEADFTHYF